MDESILESLRKINEGYEARVKLASEEVKRKQKQLRDRWKELAELEDDLEIQTKGLGESIARYMKIKDKIEAEGFDKLQVKAREKHRLHLQEITAAVRTWGRTTIELKAKIAGINAKIEGIELEYFAIWHRVAKTTLNDYERCKPGKVKLHALSGLAARKEAERRVSQGGYPFHIQIDVETKDFLLSLPLDVRFLDKHLPEVYRIIDEYQDLDFDRKFLHISYLSVSGLHPEGVILTVKNRPPHPVGNFRKLSTPEIETKE